MTISAGTELSTSTAAVNEAGEEPPGTVVLENVTRRFGSAIAVDNLSIRVEPGEFLSLLGPSGCGKTTTLRMLAGFEQPDAGSIRISGRDVIGVPPYKRNVNTVFQAYALFPHMSVAENIAYGMRQKRVPKSEVRERVREALDMVRMQSFADRKPTQLSGGQQQRIALARALVNRPSVLLLDEPLGALDRKLREEMQLELKLLQSKLGISFIFVTHDQSEALSMSDRIAVMREGRIEQLADADTIYGSPASAYVAAFIGQQNFVPGRIGDNQQHLVTDFGPIRSSREREGDMLPTGTAAQAAIRPEQVTLSNSRPQVTENAIRGELMSISHHGDSIQYLVSLAPEVTVTARYPRPNAPALVLGSTAWCSWSADSVHIFPPDPQATVEPASLMSPTEKE